MPTPVPHTASPSLPAAPRPTMAGLRRRRASIRRLAARYGASNVRVFGSVARGEAGVGSDVDFLVDMPLDTRGLALFGALQALQDDLVAALGIKVDVIRVSGTGPAVDAVLREALPL